MHIWQLSIHAQTEERGLQFKNHLQCALTPEHLREIQERLIGNAPREFYRILSVYKEIDRELFEHNPVLSTAILMMFVNPDSENSLVRLLLEPSARKKILRELKQMKDYSSKEEVRTVEASLYNLLGKKDSLFLMNNPNQYNGIALEQYLLQRKARMPLVMNMPISSDGTISLKDRNNLRDYLDKLELQCFKVDKAIQDLIQEFCHIHKNSNLFNPENLVYTSLSTSGVKRNIDSIVDSLHKERLKDPAREVSIGDINDLLRGRIIVEDYETLVAFKNLIEKNFQDQILQIKNKFIEHKDKAYRALHYYIRLSDTMLFELQLKLGAQVVIGELEHEVVFKNNTFDALDTEDLQELRKEMIALHWGVQKRALKIYLQNLMADKAFSKALKNKAPEAFAIFTAFLRYEQGEPKL